MIWDQIFWDINIRPDIETLLEMLTALYAKWVVGWKRSYYYYSYGGGRGSSNCYWLLAKHLVPVSPTSITSELLSEAWKICLHMFSLSSRPPNSVSQAWGEATKSMKLSVTFSIEWFWVWKLDNVLLLQVLFQEFLIFCWQMQKKNRMCNSSRRQ